MLKVKINNKTFYAEKGQLLSDILIENNFKVNHVCGGRGLCQKCKVNVNGESVLSCEYEIQDNVEVLLPEDGTVLSDTGAQCSGRLSRNMCFALDIGTTTLALALVSLDNREIINAITRTNPQIVFGADVISRIDYCTKNGTEALHNAVINEINLMANELCQEKLPILYASGNTTMLHILFNENPSSMGVAPYTPLFTKSKAVEGAAIGITGAERVVSLDCASAFVGADLTAGLNYVGLPQNHKYNLLVDLGTNAEILLFSENRILCTSAAAGPCFEGANVSCGMSATEGAIYEFEIDTNGRSCYKTISGAEPRGICGTGLIDVVSELLKNGIIDETGYMGCEVYHVTENVYITQNDIRQYQLAKAAVSSAITTLMNVEGVSFEQIDKVYISGGFSAKINTENAVITGLFHSGMKNKITPISNSSLLGTVKYASEKQNLSDLAENAEYIDLSLNPDFNDLFIANIDF